MTRYLTVFIVFWLVLLANDLSGQTHWQLQFGANYDHLRPYSLPQDLQTTWAEDAVSYDLSLMRWFDVGASVQPYLGIGVRGMFFHSPVSTGERDNLGQPITYDATPYFLLHYGISYALGGRSQIDMGMSHNRLIGERQEDSQQLVFSQIDVRYRYAFSQRWDIGVRVGLPLQPSQLTTVGTIDPVTGQLETFRAITHNLSLGFTISCRLGGREKE